MPPDRWGDEGRTDVEQGTGASPPGDGRDQSRAISLLRVYADAMRRGDDQKARLRALVEGPRAQAEDAISAPSVGEVDAVAAGNRPVKPPLGGSLFSSVSFQRGTCTAGPIRHVFASLSPERADFSSMPSDAGTDERIDALEETLRPLPEQIAKVAEAVERLTDETRALRVESDEGLIALRTEVREDVQGLRDDWAHDARALREDFSVFRDRLTQIGFTLVGTLFAALVALLVAVAT